MNINHLDIRDRIQTLLNQSGDETFKLFIHNGEYEVEARESSDDSILGMLTVLPSSATPLPSQPTYTLNLQIELMVKQARMHSVYNSLLQFIASNMGSNIGTPGELWLLTTDMPTVGTLEIRPTIGMSQPIYLICTLQIVDKGKISSDTALKMRIDDEWYEIPMLTMTIQRSRIPQAMKKIEREEIVNAITEQSLVISFSSIYSANVAVKAIRDDILKGALNKSYLIAIEERGEPQDERLMVLRDGTVSYEISKMPIINASFIIADDSLY